MTTERELREQEEKDIEDFLESERNPHTWANSKWFIISLVGACVILYFLAGQ